MSEKEFVMQNDVRRRSYNTGRIVYFSVFTALVIVLQCLASFVFPKLGISLNLSLIPIVLGAALCGSVTGAWLGFVSAFIILFDPTTVAFLTFNAPATIFLVLLKGTLAGFAGGVVYSVLARKNKDAAVFTSAVVTPVVNTAVFFLGCLMFFLPLIKEWAVDSSAVGFIFTAMIGVNFLVELGINMVFVPVISKLIRIKLK